MSNGFIPNFPLVINDTNNDGDYITISSVEGLVRQNLKNLLLTSPGERIMDPEFGVGLRRYLFEFNNSSVREQIRGSIVSQVRNYMPFVSITNLIITQPEELPNAVNIKLEYSVAGVTEQQILELSLSAGLVPLIP